MTSMSKKQKKRPVLDPGAAVLAKGNQPAESKKKVFTNGPKESVVT